MVFKHKSSIMLQNVQGSLDDVTATEVTRQIGIIGINAVTAVGPDLVYMTDRDITCRVVAGGLVAVLGGIPIAMGNFPELAPYAILVTTVGNVILRAMTSEPLIVTSGWKPASWKSPRSPIAVASRATVSNGCAVWMIPAVTSKLTA